MPAGALIQLVAASGEQDLYIIGNPQITFFNTVYRRHTNFSIDTVNEIFSTPAGFGKTAKCILPKKGDLISNITLNVKLGSLNPNYDNAITAAENAEHIDCDDVIDDDGNVIENSCPCRSCIEDSAVDNIKYSWVNSLGHALIKSTWIEIGGKKIDKHYGEWMEIWSELTQTQEKKNCYYEMIGKVEPSTFTHTTFPSSKELYIPLNFWFCKNQGLALPLLSLYYHDISLYVDFRRFEELWVKKVSTDPSATKPFFDSSLLIEYIYLDLEERKKFYEESQVYLIEQIQTTDACNSSYSVNGIDMYFNHPVKELVWVLQRDDVTDLASGIYHDSTYPIGNDWFNFGLYPCRSIATVKDPFDSAMIQINGLNRIEPLPASYFRLVESYYRHTCSPNNYIYTYSFGLKPEEHQPTGHLNFSRINNARLVIKMHDNMTKLEKSVYEAKVYAVNYNILVISKGMGGLLFNT